MLFASSRRSCRVQLAPGKQAMTQQSNDQMDFVQAITQLKSSIFHIRNDDDLTDRYATWISYNTMPNLCKRTSERERKRKTSTCLASKINAENSETFFLYDIKICA